MSAITSLSRNPSINPKDSNSINSVRHTIDGYPKSLKLYQVTNSPSWQIHIRFGSHIITKSSKTVDLNIAEARAKSLFNELIGFRYKPHNVVNLSTSDKSTRFADITEKVIAI